MGNLVSLPAVSSTRHAIQKAQHTSCKQLVVETVSWKLALITDQEA